MRVMWGKKGDGGFLRVLNPFFRWFAPKLRVGGCSRNCVLTRGSAPHPRTLHPIHNAVSILPSERRAQRYSQTNMMNPGFSQGMLSCNSGYAGGIFRAPADAAVGIYVYDPTKMRSRPSYRAGDNDDPSWPTNGGTNASGAGDTIGDFADDNTITYDDHK